uniref:Tyrosine specific protein phosphatases domain-containing protein n=1 Tax=Mola mola TaxID=94237 RepID=A0A3Q3WCQ3_MOLML
MFSLYVLVSKQWRKSKLTVKATEKRNAVGKRLHGTRFIAFKVPLKQSLNLHLRCSDVFGPWELLDTMNKGNQELGLIIDLTFTTRYYRLQDVPDSLMLIKIFTAGHEVPSDDTILSFKRAVRRFLRDNADNDKLIGVHCTHGLNRTGYLICRYLIDVDGMDPKEAHRLLPNASWELDFRLESLYVRSFILLDWMVLCWLFIDPSLF